MWLAFANAQIASDLLQALPFSTALGDQLSLPHIQPVGSAHVDASSFCAFDSALIPSFRSLKHCQIAHNRPCALQVITIAKLAPAGLILSSRSSRSWIDLAM